MDKWVARDPGGYLNLDHALAVSVWENTSLPAPDRWQVRATLLVGTSTSEYALKGVYSETDAAVVAYRLTQGLDPSSLSDA